MQTFHFEVFKDLRNEWRWNFYASNGQCIATSGEGYKNRQDALHGIQLVKQHAANGPIYDRSLKSWLTLSKAA